jgi:DNA-binding LacI/PurR family transcriptional regulator
MHERVPGNDERRSVGASVTLRDVARQAGVSITTVSRTLNGRETGVPIREETTRRILAVAAELGYKPNLLARGLRGSPSSLIGVIVRDVADPFHTQVLRGVNEAARGRDYRLFLGHVDYRADVALSYGSMFERSHADGIIVIGDLEGASGTIGVLAEQHGSIVGVTDRTGPREIPGVYSDGVMGSRLVMEHLWGLGHRRISCVSDLQTSDGRQRIELYEAFMRSHGADEAIRVEIIESPGAPEPAYQAGRRLFAGGPGAAEHDATAIFATSDTIAIGLIRAAAEVGIVIPRDLSIVGYDDIDIVGYTIPPLTTVSQSGPEMGRIAAEMLFEMIDTKRERSAIADVIVPPRLIIRESTGPAPVRTGSPAANR